MIRDVNGIRPHIAESAVVDETALIIGKVTIGENVSVWPHALIRADEHEVMIEEDAAILDKAFIEAPRRTIIGKKSIISHGAMIHGSIIGENVLVGIGAIVLEVSVGENSIIAAGAVVTEDVEKNSFMSGIPARKKREVTEGETMHTGMVAEELMTKARHLAEAGGRSPRKF